MQNQLLQNQEILADYLELYAYIITLASYEGAMLHQSNLWYGGDEVYIDTFKENFVYYKANVKTINDKLSRLMTKIELNPNFDFEGVPEEMNSISDLEDFRATLSAGIDSFEDLEFEMNSI